MMENKHLWRIFSMRLCRYLVEEVGINYVKVEADLLKPGFKNWLFEDTPELHQAMDKWIENRKR